MNEHVKVRARELGLPTNTQEAMPVLLLADASVIRAAIALVQDGGCECSVFHDKAHPWFFTDDESEHQTEHRQKFVDAVVARIRELQSEPFNLGIKLENYCNRHLKAKLPQPTVYTCVDCEVEMKERR